MIITSLIKLLKEPFKMTQSKGQQERQWKVRKQSQNPHGKVKSFEELAEEITPENKSGK